jgi:hypothetical protein
MPICGVYRIHIRNHLRYGNTDMSFPSFFNWSMGDEIVRGKRTSRSYFFTEFDVTPEKQEWLKNLKNIFSDMKYICFVIEKDPHTEQLYLQGLLIWKYRTTITETYNRLGDRINVEAVRSSPYAAYLYVSRLRRSLGGPWQAGLQPSPHSGRKHVSAAHV